MHLNTSCTFRFASTIAYEGRFFLEPAAASRAAAAADAPAAGGFLELAPFLRDLVLALALDMFCFDGITLVLAVCSVCVSGQVERRKWGDGGHDLE